MRSGKVSSRRSSRVPPRSPGRPIARMAATVPPRSCTTMTQRIIRPANKPAPEQHGPGVQVNEPCKEPRRTVGDRRAGRLAGRPERADPSRHPNPRIHHPDDIARLLTALCQQSSDRASRSNSATVSVSARRSAAMSAARSRLSPPSAFSAPRSILRRWPKAAAVSRSMRAEQRRAGLLGMRDEADHGGPHLGRRHEGAGRHAQQQRARGSATAPAPPAGHRQRCPGAAQIRSATSCWNISVMPLERARPGAASRPAAASRCCRAGWR